MNKEDLALLQKMVTTLRAEGKYKETIENCYNLLNIGMNIKDYKSVLTAYVNLVASFYCIGYIKEAFGFLNAYEKICNKYGDESDKLNLYNILFLLYAYNKNYDKAKATLEKSIELGKKLKKYNIVSNGYSNYSHVYIIEGKFVKALEMGKMGLQMAKLHKPDSLILEFRVKLNIAKSYIELENFDAAKHLIDEMINHSIMDSFPREKTECYDLKGHWYLKQKIYRKSFESFTYAKNLAESYNDLNLLKSIQEERIKICELISDINTCYAVQKEYIALLNEIRNRELENTALKMEIKHSISEIEKIANTDYLTGLCNRKYLEETTNKLLKKANGKNESIVCIEFDIDNFKYLNDKYGHLFGDEILKRVSKACMGMIRENDLFGRFGGDEFVIILNKAVIEDGKNKAEQILEAIRNLNIEKDGIPIPITISIGVIDSISYKSIQFYDLFNITDKMLYKAKQNGKNQLA